MAKDNGKPYVNIVDDDKKKKSTGKSYVGRAQNRVANMIDMEFQEKTSHRSAMWADSMVNPYNPDDLVRKDFSYGIYEKMMKDDQIEVCLNIKKDLILGSGWSIKTEDEEDEEIRREIESGFSEKYEGCFDDDLEEILTAYEFGFSVTEKQFKTDDSKLCLKKLKTRHPSTWLFHQDEFGNVERYEQWGSDGDRFGDINPDAIIHFVNNGKFGNPYGRSDLRSAYTAWFIKNQITKYYAIYLEKYASPTPVGTYKVNALEDQVDDLFDALKKLQNSSALVIPDVISNLEFLEASGDGAVYINGITLFNMFIGRSLFLPDLLGFQGGPTTGGSQALGREQMVVFFKHIMRRRRSLERVINEEIIKPMIIWNHGFMEHYPKFCLNPILEETAIENGKLWLEAVKGGVKPTLEEIKHFKKIIDFPESEDQDLMDESDPIEEMTDPAEIPPEVPMEGINDPELGTADPPMEASKGEKPEIYMVVGVPGSGKSWVCEQMQDKFTYVHHDGYIGHIKQPEKYVEAIVEKAAKSSKPMLTEAPFSVSKLKEPLEAQGFKVETVFIIEDDDVVATRYQQREGKEIPLGHITRMKTYKARAEESGSFYGGSEDVLKYLKSKAEGKQEFKATKPDKLKKPKEKPKPIAKKKAQRKLAKKVYK